MGLWMACELTQLSDSCMCLEAVKSLKIGCIQGPGDNSTDSDDPFVLFTGRMYNNLITPGVMRMQQGGG